MPVYTMTPADLNAADAVAEHGAAVISAGAPAHRVALLVAAWLDRNRAPEDRKALAEEFRRLGVFNLTLNA